jgi:acetyl esterase/lipase
MKVEKDVEYVPNGGKSQSLDIYYPVKTDKPLPLIVQIHGGGWRGGDKAGGCPYIPQAQAGRYVVASINYRFSKQAIFPAQIQDCQAAIRWLRANANKYNIDPGRIGVSGDSAGGHLVALLGTAGGTKAFHPIGGNEDKSDKVQAVVDWFGPTDFINFAAQEVPPLDGLHSTALDSPISELFGGPVSEHKELALSASPIHYVSKDSAPILIEHGNKDALVPIAQSIEFAAALEKAGVDVTFHNIKDASHGPGIIRDGFIDVLVGFFDKHLKPADTKK